MIKTQMILFLLLNLSFSAYAEDPQSVSLAIIKRIESQPLEAMPLQDRGRLKPFHTFARETNLFLTGKHSFFAADPVSFYLSLLLHPQVELLEIINVRDVTLRRDLEIPHWFQ